MKVPLSLAIALSGLLFCGGYFVRSCSAPDADANGSQSGAGSPESAARSAAEKRGGRKTQAGSAAESVSAAPPPAEARTRTLRALEHRDQFVRLRELMEALAGMNEENADAITDAMVEQYRAGYAINFETELVQTRRGQVLKEKAMVELPAEPNGRLNFPPQQRMKGWATVDPQGAKAWLEKLEDGSVKETLRAKWLEGLSIASPQTIMEEFPSLGVMQQRAVIGGLLSGIHMEGGLPALNAWFDANADKTETAVLHSAFGGLLQRMSQNFSEWDASAELVKKGAAKGLVNRFNFEMFTANMGTENPGKCLDLVAELSEIPSVGPQVAESMIVGVVDRSTTTSFNSLATWLNENKDYPLYDAAVLQFSARMKKDDPAAALVWAQTIKDEAMRAKAVAALEGK